MKTLVLFTAALLVGLCSPNPVTDVSDDKIVIDSEFFDENFKVYTSEHDIINLVLPLNALNFEDDDDSDDDNYCNNNYHLFYTEVDFGVNGEKIYKGLFVLRNGTAFKLLENGRDSTAAHGDSKDVYFAASDGIYKYNAELNKAEKYGSLDDNFIHIVQENNVAETTLYAINDKFEMFKITAEGTKKVKLDDVPNAQQLVMDFENNIYFYDNNKLVYVINGEGVTQIKGLKADPEYIQLLKPAFLFENYVPLVVDDQSYLVYANGTFEMSDFIIKNRPTGYALEGTLIQFYAYEKKIYEYNVMKIILEGLLGDLKEYFEDNVKTMEEVATRSRSSLRSKPKSKH